MPTQKHRNVKDSDKHESLRDKDLNQDLNKSRTPKQTGNSRDLSSKRTGDQSQNTGRTKNL
jgi:hypothetical protein